MPLRIIVLFIHQLEIELAESISKFGVILSLNVLLKERVTARSCFMFVDKYSGAVYKPASYKAPAKHIRFWINQLADNPEICDPYGSFLYIS